MRRRRLLRHIRLSTTSTRLLRTPRTTHLQLTRLRIPTRHRRGPVLAQHFDMPVVRPVRDVLVALAAVVVGVGVPVR